MPGPDIALVGQDPRFGGGSRSQAETIWRGTEELGRESRLFYLSRKRQTSLLRPGLALKPREERQPPFVGTAYPSFLPELDGLNQLVGGRRMAKELRSATSLWVCASSAPYGYGALASGRPYACWIATSLRDEWAVRAPLLPLSRRVALRLNAPLLLRLERAVLRGATAVYAISPYSRVAIAQAGGLPLERVRGLPIPIAFDLLTPDPAEEWLRGLEQPTIAFVGRASDPRKNLGLLLDAFARLRLRHPSARLRLIGESPRPDVRLGEGVELVGEVESVPDALSGTSLFVLPSFQEGFGIVVAEALAKGIPAIVTPCGGPEDLVRDSRAGIVLEGFDPAELAAVMESLLADPERLLEMRRLGREHVIQAHSPERFSELLAAAFRELDGDG